MQQQFNTIHIRLQNNGITPCIITKSDILCKIIVNPERLLTTHAGINSIHPVKSSTCSPKVTFNVNGINCNMLLDTAAMRNCITAEVYRKHFKKHTLFVTDTK